MTANSPRTRMNKGRQFQKVIKDIFMDKYPSLTEDDIRTPVGAENGSDIILSKEGKSFVPFDIEIKRTEKLNLWGAIKQAETNSSSNRIPLVIFKRNRSKIYCCLEFGHFMDVISKKYSKHLLNDEYKRYNTEVEEDESK